jgi:hypothetical protein
MAADWQEGTRGAQTQQARIMDGGWCGLAWAPWAVLERDAIRRAAPALPGVYRIRHAGGKPERLVYVGQTGRALRERLLSLAAGANAAACPFNDPHTAAPHLWLLRQEEEAALECSCAPVAGGVQTLRGTEDMLLWRHRIEAGCSTEANYGRFFPGWSRPTNRWIVRGGASRTRTPGRRAERLAAAAGALDFSVGHPVLAGPGRPLDASWWQRAPLHDFRFLPPGPAVYAIHDRASAEVTYVGETSALPRRAATHAAASWPLAEPTIAFMPLPAGTPKHVLRELESDILGWHFFVLGQAPALQYAEAVRTGRTV